MTTMYSRLPGFSRRPSSGKPQKTLDETLKSFESVPLFMKDLPTEDEASTSSSAALDALQSLAFSGTPNEQANNFKSHGNDYFKAKRHRDALGFYDQAIAVEPDDAELLLSLHLNRAACQLALGNYRSALRDTSNALGIDPRSQKAFYRAARALFELGRFVEAIDCCDHILEIDASNAEAVALRANIVERAQRREKHERENAERQARQKENDLALHRALLARGLWIESSPRPPADHPAKAHFDPDTTTSQPPDIVRHPLVLPVLLLYPQYGQSDLIEAFHEDTTVGAHLDAMFPPESRGSLSWDTKGEYVSSKLNVYASTRKRRLLRVGRSLSLREVIDQGAQDSSDGDPKKRDGVVLRDGILSLVVLPKGTDAEKKWIDEFKKDREANAGQE